MRIRYVFVPIAFALSTAAPAMAQPPKQAAGSKVEEDNSRLRAVFRKGAASIAAGKYEEARLQLLEAWSMRKSPDVATLLGQAELETKHYCDAAYHLEYGLANFAPVESEQNLQEVRQTFEDAKSHIGQLRITVSRDHAMIRVDDRDVGVAPLQGSVFLDPGIHVIEARSGIDGVRKQISAEAGKQYAVDLVLPSLQASPVPATSAAAPHDSTRIPAPIDANQDEQRSIVPVIIGGTVALAGLGSGLGLRLASNSEESTANAQFAKVGAGGCTNGSTRSADCAALLNSLKKSDRERNWSTVGFVAGGTALIATAVYWFWPRESTGTSSRVWRVSGNVGSNSSSISVEGSF